MEKGLLNCWVKDKDEKNLCEKNDTRLSRIEYYISNKSSASLERDEVDKLKTLSDILYYGFNQDNYHTFFSDKTYIDLEEFFLILSEIFNIKIFTVWESDEIGKLNFIVFKEKVIHDRDISIKKLFEGGNYE